MPWIWGTFMHTGQKYALNMGQRILTSEKYALDLGHVYAHRAEICPRFRARFHPSGRSMNQIQGKVSPPWGWLARNLRHKKTSPEWLYLFLD